MMRMSMTMIILAGMMTIRLEIRDRCYLWIDVVYVGMKLVEMKLFGMKLVGMK
jgi:hypothetical protein